MPQFWIAIFFIFLAVAQLYDSIKDINLPFQVYLVLGTLLAVASNSQAKFSLDHPRQPAATGLPLAALGLSVSQATLLAPATSKDRHELHTTGLDRDSNIHDC
ncbi:MAG: hypothetical protein LH474_14135 [Chamaesiphon sp.]|nr:hypothetical protein [Chamaesiphon sp.]